MTQPYPGQRPLPHPTTLSQPFWDATKESRLVIQRCTTCKAFFWLPQMACRDCRTETLEWTDVSGRGLVYSYVVLPESVVPTLPSPHVVAVVTLDEGPRFLTDLVDVDLDHLEIGMPVHVKFEDCGDLALPHFTPSATKES